MATRAATGGPNPIVCCRISGAGIAVLPFDAEDAAHRRRHPGLSGEQGHADRPYDCLIAAQARRRAHTLVTANGREFAARAGADGDGMGLVM